MIARDLITQSFLPAKLGEESQAILRRMNEQTVRHLPVVKHGRLVGMLAAESLQNIEATEKIDALPMTYIGKYVEADDHVFEVLKHMADHQLTSIPVVKDSKLNYLGTITQDDIMQFIAATDSIVEPGCIVVLQMKKQDYSLAEISRIIESENVSILSTLITSPPEREMLEVALKLNTRNAASIIHTLERYEYDIKATFEEDEYTESIKERYDGLMSYLSI